MQQFSKKFLESILSVEDTSLKITMQMHTEVKGAQTRKNHLQFKNLVKEVEAQLEKRDSIEPNKQLLENLHSKIEDDNFWQNQDKGLLVIASEEKQDPIYVKLSGSVSDKAVVAEHYFLRDAVRWLLEPQHYLLSLDKSEPALYYVSSHTLTKLDPVDFPDSKTSALSHYQADEDLQFHSSDSSGSAPVYHGNNPEDDKELARDKEFYNIISKSLAQHFEKPQKILIVGSKQSREVYASVEDKHHILAQTIGWNRTNEAEQDLVTKYREYAHSNYQDLLKEIVAEIENNNTTGKASTDVADISVAAATGRVENLVVIQQSSDYGILDLENLTVKFDKNNPEARDLLNLAVVNTLENNGNVYVISGEDAQQEFSNPNTIKLAANYRYSTE